MVKGSKSDKEATYEFRDIVLAKVRGYPPWPGMVRSSSTVFQPCSHIQHILQPCLGRGPSGCLERGTPRASPK